MGDWGAVESVELVKDAVDRRVGYEVVDVILLCGQSCSFVHEGGGASK